MAGIIAHNEEYGTGLARIRSDESGKIDSGHSGARYHPGGRNAPVAAIGKAGRAIRKTGRLSLWQGHRRPDRTDEPAAVSPIVAHAINVDTVGHSIRRYFKGDGLARVHTNLGGKTLNVRRARSGNIPLALGIAWQAILLLDRVFRCCAFARHRKSQA